MGVVVSKPKFQKRTTTAIKSKDLLTHEEALKAWLAPLFKIWLKLPVISKEGV